MADAPKKKNPDALAPSVVTLDQDEFNKICKRVHSMLMMRSEKAREKKDKRPTKKASQNYIEASKEVFVFVHLLELVENMTEEISDLRAIVASVGEELEEEEQRSPVKGWPEMFSTNKKRFVN
jgi:hypothetical protein